MDVYDYSAKSAAYTSNDVVQSYFQRIAGIRYTINAGVCAKKCYIHRGFKWAAGTVERIIIGHYLKYLGPWVPSQSYQEIRQYKRVVAGKGAKNRSHR